MKILSPAGNFESLKMAVYNGADEVYLGINSFNARNNIDGFSIETLEEAVDFAHIYNVKVNLAINILFRDDELQDAVDVIVDSYNLGVDSFIIQDLGLASLVHDNYPEIEIHASTQMGIHNLEGVKAIEKFGFERVVLARETPLDEIKRIRENTDIEIEYFAQGALCVSFSGNCYISSYLCGASGNRGKCKQLCRLPYALEFGGKVLKKGYLLSAKDFNMIDKLDELKKAGVDVLKIEGRARRPFYVAMATREYFNALNGKNANTDNLKLAFNREYTAGYFDGNGDIISNFHAHIGVKIGKVEKVNIGKKFNEIYFSSNRKLYPKSTFKFFRNGEEQNTLTAFDIYEEGKNKYKITTTQKVCVGDFVNLILDSSLEDSVLCYSKKRKLSVEIFAKENESIKAMVDVGDEKIEVLGEVLQAAKNRPLTQEDFILNFKKSELFDACLVFKHFNSVFTSTKILNEFRRKVFEVAQNSITKKRKRNLKTVKIKESLTTTPLKDFQIIQKTNENYLAKNIIYSPEVYELDAIKSFKDKCDGENRVAYLDLPNFALKKDIELLRSIIDKLKINFVANNYYALEIKGDYIIGAGLNVYNSVTSNILKVPFIAAEGDLEKRILAPYMTLRHCPMKSHLNASCDKCPYEDGYGYRMDNGMVLKLKRKKLSTCTFYLE